MLSLAPNSLPEIRADVRRLSSALGTPERGEELLESIEARLAAVAERGRRRPRRRVAVIEWIEPLMSAGNWTPTLAALAGGDEVLGAPGRHSGRLEWQALRESDPEALIVAPCGFDLARTRAELAPLLARPGLRELRALREGRAAIADGNAFFNRPGPRLVETAEALLEMIHPELPGFGRRGEVWEPLRA